MNSNSIFSFFKRPENVIDDVTAISSLAPKILTSENDLAKVQPYIDKLKDTLNAKGINNIALTGGYGSGKSTLLNTFQHLHKNNFKFLNISLAAFNQTKIKENYKDIYEIKIKNGKSEKEAEKEIINDFKETIISNNEVEKQLEISILQQIIYKVKPSNLPESRFKRIVNIPNWKLWGLIPLCFIFWLLSLILLFKYDYLNSINPRTWTYKNNLDWSSVGVFLISFLGIGYFSKLVVELFSNSKINKVNLKGEIEIGDDSNKSILNEHYDEILYYFEKNDFNVVVIEDLDRFDNTNIFTKLRELNILLNNADTIRNKPAYRDFGIKFLYAVGDDLFNDKKERVKFFEYIIPVIPFINSSNANDQLKTLIKDSDLEDNVFPRVFISDITTFIDDIDMRLLINIFHEFVIYRNILKPDVISGREAELFAMITYKNIDPEDFNKLNSKEGKLYELIFSKKKYIKKLEDDLVSKIKLKNTEIKNIKNENISNIKELRRIYINQILTKFPDSPIYLSTIRINNFIEEKEFDQLIKTENISYNWYNRNYGSSQNEVLKFKFSEIENEINSDFTYEERVELIKNKHSNRIDLLQKEIEKLTKEKAVIQNWDLKQIFKEVDINQYLSDFSNNGLLRNLILEGYISENYNDYISLFHEVSLTREDKKFERNVKSGISEGFEYKLTHIDNLIGDHIDLKYFERETILNFDLLNYMGGKYNEYSEQYDLVIKLLSNEKEKSIEFIDLYVSDEARPLNIFVEKLVENWKGFWEYIYSNHSDNFHKVDKYLRLLINYSELLTIIKNQNNKLLKEAIEKNPRFLSLIKESDDLFYFAKIANLFEHLNIKFEKLDNPTEENKELFDFVYKNSNYEINIGNLIQMLELYQENEGLFETANYSTIQNSNCKPLIEYVNSEINIYAKNVYLKLDQNKFEEEESLINLLNNRELNSQFIFDIIEKVDTKISDLSRIKNKIDKGVLLYENKVVPKWTNVIDYYTDCAKSIDKDLISYLNFENVYTKLSLTKIPIKTTEFNNEIFEIEILKNNNISDKSYIMLTNSCNHKWKNLNFKELNENKVIHLIKERLGTTKENYDLLRENFSNNHIKLIENDFIKFINKLDDFATDEQDILMLLRSEKIIINNKFNYISTLDQQVIIDNKDVARKVGEIIISKSSKVDFEFNTIESIVESLNSIENKVKLVNIYSHELNSEYFISLVKSIGYYYSELFVKQHKPTFSDNTFNKELLNKLKLSGLIKNFGIDKKDKTIIRAVANY